MKKKINWLHFSLLGSIFCLPLFEAPKTYFFLLFVVVWLLKAKKNRSWGGQWRVIDSILLLWIVSALLVSINANVNYGYSLSGFFDVFRYVLIGWLVSRTYFSDREIQIIVIVLSISSLSALIQAFLDCPAGGECFELNSVGHVNHSAIYLLVSASLLVSFLVFWQQEINKAIKIFLWVVLLIFAWSIFDTESRAASVGVVFLSLFIIGFWLRKCKSKKRVLLTFFCISSLLLIAMVRPPDFMVRHSKLTKFFKNSETPREKIRRFSYHAFRLNPMMGIGFGNYNRLTLESIRGRVISTEGDFDESLYMVNAHAHNIYYTYLISGGIIVTSIFLWFWGWLVYMLYSVRNKLGGVGDSLWSASVCIVLIDLGIGVVNTTLHHEVAMLSMIIISLFIGCYRQAEIFLSDNREGIYTNI